MNPEANIQLLTVIHEMQIASSEARIAMTTLIDEATTNAVTLPMDSASSLCILLEVQSQLLMHLLQENGQMRDGLDKFERKLDDMLQ